MRAAIVGCGLIGRKRAENLPNGVEIVGCYDVDQRVAMQFSLDFGVRKFENLETLIQENKIDFVIIATRHDSLSNLASIFLESNINVFLEKPGAIKSLDLQKAIEISKVRNLHFHIGFNHRYHPGFLKAMSLINSGSIGELMFLRARYGHGGRLGYEKEWRAIKELSGGGELIDQGSHLIDLSLALLGDLNLSFSKTATYFWNMEVEDNVFMLLSSQNGTVAHLHASCTEWKNMFSLEIYGKLGKLELNGLGRSYGLETLTYYKMKPEMGPPEAQKWEFELDTSWHDELSEFVTDLKKNTSASDNTNSSVKVLEIIEEIYRRESYDHS